MVTAAIHDLYVNVRSGSSSKSIKEVHDKFGLKIAHHRNIHLFVDYVGDATRQINRRNRESLIHRHHEISRSQNSFLVSESLGKGLAKSDADIFNRVVLVDVKIANALELQIEASVTRKEFEHVIEEAYPRRYDVGSLSIDIEAQGDFRFSRVALDDPNAFRPDRLRCNSHFLCNVAHA